MQEYIKTDRQIHWLSQVITRVNRAYVPGKEDDSHTNLAFDPLTNRLFGRWIEGPSGSIISALDLRSLDFLWLDALHHTLHRVPVWNHTTGELVSELAVFPASHSMDTAPLHLPLHFAIPEYGISSLNKGEVSAEGLQQWVFFRTLANQACTSMLGYLQDNSEVRIWPHHFDTGVYSMLTERFGLGFGWAMNDPMAGQPYFYMAGYNQDSPLSYSGLPQLSHGRWVTGTQWNGAILPMEALNAATRVEAEETVQTFIREAAAFYLR